MGSKVNGERTEVTGLRSEGCQIVDCRLSNAKESLIPHFGLLDETILKILAARYSVDGIDIYRLNGRAVG
jgi:hypothetical protein